MISCLVCSRMAMVRGLCMPHYQEAQKRVKRGKTTWEELMKEGKILPAISKQARADKFYRTANPKR